MSQIPWTWKVKLLNLKEKNEPTEKDLAEQKIELLAKEKAF